MGKMCIRVLILAMIAAMMCAVTTTTQAKELLPPRIVPADSAIRGHPSRVAVRKQHHRKAVRHHRKRR